MKAVMMQMPRITRIANSGPTSNQIDMNKIMLMIIKIRNGCIDFPLLYSQSP